VKLGITSWTCRWAIRSGLDAQGVLEYAAGLGLGVVQFCENLPLWDLSASEVDDLLAASGELGVAVQLGTKGLDSELLRQCLDLTERLGSRVLRLALGASDADEAEKALRGVLPDCDEHGITLALENQFDLPSAELALVIKALNDPLVAACLDSANSVAFLEKPLDTADTLAQFAVRATISPAARWVRD
jgi:sugar phosphate isomerase/epimerase